MIEKPWNHWRRHFLKGWWCHVPPHRKLLKFTISQRAELKNNKIKIKINIWPTKNTKTKLTFFVTPGDFASIRPSFSASDPNVKKTLTWLQIRRLLSGKSFSALQSWTSQTVRRSNQSRDTGRRKRRKRKNKDGTPGNHPRVPPWSCRCTRVACLSLLNLARFAHHCTRAAACSHPASQWFLCIYLPRSQQRPDGGGRWRSRRGRESRSLVELQGPDLLRPPGSTLRLLLGRETLLLTFVLQPVGQKSKAVSDRKQSRQLDITTRDDTRGQTTALAVTSPNLWAIDTQRKDEEGTQLQKTLNSNNRSVLEKKEFCF